MKRVEIKVTHGNTRHNWAGYKRLLPTNILNKTLFILLSLSVGLQSWYPIVAQWRDRIMALSTEYITYVIVFWPYQLRISITVVFVFCDNSSVVISLGADADNRAISPWQYCISSWL